MLSRRSALIAAGLIGLLLAGPVAAQDLYVDDDNLTGSEDGSMVQPYTSIQAAVTAAAGGSTVHVAAGSYPGNVTVWATTLHLLGGYPGGTPASYGAGTPGDFGARDPVANTTDLTGAGDDAALTLFETGLSTVDGFRISGGTGGALYVPWSYRGGGIFCSGGAPTISNNVIEANDMRLAAEPTADLFGGGIYSENAATVITGNTVRNNYSGRGGGIAVAGGQVVISDNLVEANVGISDHGGGIFAGSSAPLVITANTIHGNEVGRDLGWGWGGGLIVYGAGTSVTLSFNEVTANYAPTYGSGEFIDEGAEAWIHHELVYANLVEQSCAGGGAIAVDGGEGIGSVVTLDHCTVADNACASYVGGNGLLVAGLSQATVTNSIFWGNGGDDVYADASSSVSVTYSTTEQGVGGTGNLSSDPLFVDLAGGDLHLRSQFGRWNPHSASWVNDASTSPAIDAGAPASPYSAEPAPNGGRCNQGAHGNTVEASHSEGGSDLIFADGFASGTTNSWSQTIQ